MSADLEFVDRIGVGKKRDAEKVLDVIMGKTIKKALRELFLFHPIL